MAVDRICEKLQITLKKPWFKPYLYGECEYRGFRICLAKPLTFMNRSGDAAESILARAKLSPESLVVICDTLDLPTGTLRLRTRGSGGGHNGLKSLIYRLGTGDFMRLYIGIGRPPAENDVVSHVLGEPSDRDSVVLRSAILRAADGVLDLLVTSPEGVMNEINGNRR